MRRTTPRPPDPGADPDFFDDAYHRLLAPFHTEAEARRETAALRELLGLAQSDRVLDLGCGWGRHLRLLAAAGHDVVGLDLSVALLRRARTGGRPADTRAGDGAADALAGDGAADARAGDWVADILAGDGRTDTRAGDMSRLPLIAGDMRRVPLADDAFDVVLNLATSMGLFLDDPPAIRALGEARRVLRTGGRILVEGMHRADVEAHFAARDAWTLDDGTVVRARRRFDPDRGVSHEVLRWEGPGGAGEKRHSLRIRSGREMAALLEAAGIRVVAGYGDWTGTPFTDASPRLILLGEARA